MNSNTPPVVVSMIIVSWNTKNYLIQCLNTLAPETCPYPMEIIVVDNASTDGSAEWVAQYFPHVRLIQNAANLGFAKANNIGASLSQGQYLCFINSDVKVRENCITRLVDYCEKNPGVGMAGPHIFGGDGKTQRTCRGFPGLWNMFCRALALDTVFPEVKLFTGYSLSYWPQNDLQTVDILSGCFWLVRRAAIQQTGLLDESFFMYGEDMDWCKRFREAGWSLAFVPTAEAIHFGGASSANDPIRFYVEMQRADLQYWKKHHPTPVFACYYLIACLHMLLRAMGYSVAFSFHAGKRHTYRHKTKRSMAGLLYLFTGRSLVSRNSFYPTA